MFDVLNNIYKRLDKLFRKRGYVRDDGEVQTTDQDGEVPMPFRPRAPKKYRRKGLMSDNPRFQNPDPDVMSIQGWCNIRYKWFSLHAAVAIKGDDRACLKQLFRYTSRPSVSLSQLSYVTPDDPIPK
jgi:hypothetical protein